MVTHTHTHTHIYIYIYIYGPCNGLLPDGTKPLPDPMLPDHQWCLVAFNRVQFCREVINIFILVVSLKINDWRLQPHHSTSQRVKPPKNGNKISIDLVWTWRTQRCVHRLHFQPLTHWGRATHICVGNLTIIGSDNGLSPGRCQAITRTNVRILLIGPLGTTFSEMLIEIHTFSFKKINLKMSSGKWRPFCLGLNVLTHWFSGNNRNACLQLCVVHVKRSTSQHPGRG